MNRPDSEDSKTLTARLTHRAPILTISHLPTYSCAQCALFQRCLLHPFSYSPFGSNKW